MTRTLRQRRERRPVATGARRMFRIRITGDTMMPKWRHGAIVECREIGVGEKLQPGRDYCVFLRDGQAWFMRLAAAANGELTFKRINQVMPRRVMVARERINRLAIATGEVIPLEMKEGGVSDSPVVPDFAGRDNKSGLVTAA